MSSRYVYNMTEGNEVSLLLKFSLPMLIGNIFQQLYNMVDSIIVGRYVGADALGAVGATGSITFLFFSLCNGMATGIGILIAQYFGADNEKQVKKSIANSIYIITTVGLLMTIVSVIFARDVLVLMDTPTAILEDSVTYMQIVCSGTLAVAAYNAIAAILRALGDTKTPLIFLSIACVVNIIFDLLFVIEFGLGVKGVAIATIMSQFIAAITCILYARIKNPYFHLEAVHIKVDWLIIKKCASIGFPVAIQNSLIALSCVVLQKVVNGFGEVVVAANTAVGRIEQLVQQPFNSLGAAVSTFTGQNIGANKLERVKRGYHKSSIMVAIFAVLMLITAQTMGDAIIRIFVDDKEVIDFGARALKITSCFYFPLGMIYTSRSLLNGAGDAVASMINGIMEVVGRVMFPMLLVSIPAIGVWGIWYTTGLTWFITGAASMIRYMQGKWKYKSLVRS